MQALQFSRVNVSYTICRVGRNDRVFVIVKPGLYFSRRQSPGSATDADSRACVYTSAGDCRQRKWATVVSGRRL